MIREDLARLADLGLCLIAVCGCSCAGDALVHRHGLAGAGKTPRRPDWAASRYRPAAELVREHRDGDNAGVLCGLVPDAPTCVVVLDADDAEAAAWMAAHLPPTPWRVRTRRGEHWYYRAPAGAVASCVRRGGLALDVRGQGSQVVAPWSVHRSGDVYVPVGGPWTPEGAAALPTYDPAWLSSLSEGDEYDASLRLLMMRETVAALKRRLADLDAQAAALPKKRDDAQKLLDSQERRVADLEVELTAPRGAIPCPCGAASTLFKRAGEQLERVAYHMTPAGNPCKHAGRPLGEKEG